MSFDLSGHEILALESEACHGRTSHWLDLKLTAAHGQVMEWSLFFSGPHAAAAVGLYAAAINEANKKIAALELPVEVPSIVAEKCRAVVEDAS